MKNTYIESDGNIFTIERIDNTAYVTYFKNSKAYFFTEEPLTPSGKLPKWIKEKIKSAKKI